MLALTLSSLLESPIHASTVRRELPKVGLRWRRARPTLQFSCPASAQRRRTIKRRLAAHQPAVEIFYIDEVDIDLNPKIGFLWSPLGQQQTIPTPGKKSETLSRWRLACPNGWHRLRRGGAQVYRSAPATIAIPLSIN